MKRYIAGITLLAVFGGKTEAADAQFVNYGALEDLFGEPVTTSVTGSPQRASDVPATMEIITDDEIRRSGAKDIPGILRHVVGVNVLQWTNSAADVSVRGYNKAFSSRLLVLINGRQVYADHYGYTPWTTLPVELSEIRQIEIVKGPNSALFGFNAVGGVINIVTYNPLDDRVSSVSLAGGTQDHYEGSAVVTMRPDDDVGIRLSAGIRRNDDYATPISPEFAGARRREERNSVSLDARFRLSDAVRLDVEASYIKAGQADVVPNYIMSFEELTTTSVKGQLAADTDLGLIELTAYQNWTKKDPYLSAETEPFLRFDNPLTVVQLQDIFKVGSDHTFRLSLEYRHSSENSTPFEGGVIHYHIASAGGMWNWKIDSSLALTNAVRVDRLALGRRGSLPEGFVFTNGDWDRNLTEFSYNSGLVWQPTSIDTLRLTAARGAQLPNLFDLGGNLWEIPLPPGFGPPVIFLAGLPDLKPTVVTNYEFGWDRRLEAIDGKFRLALFHGNTHDVLADFGRVIPEALVFAAPANVGNSKTSGFEISVKGRIPDGWRWGAGYIYQDIDDRFAAGIDVSTAQINYEDTNPKHVVDANLGWAGGRWEIDAFLRYLSDFSSIAAANQFAVSALTPISDYVSVDGRIAFRLTDTFTVAVAGQNLLQSQQRQHSAPEVERRVLARVRADF